MNLKSFTAGSMAEALALVKKHLGPHAVILHTRKYRRGGVLGIGTKQVVEITASDQPVPPRPRLPQKPVGAATQPVAPLSLPRRAPMEPSAGDLIRRTYAVAQSELRKKQPPPPLVIPPAAAFTPVFTPGPAPAAAQAFTARPAGNDDLVQEMRVVQRMVSRMLSQQRQRDAKASVKPDMPDTLFDQYLTLLRQEVTEELAEEVIHTVQTILKPGELDDAAAVRRAVHAEVAKLIPTDDASMKVVKPADGRPRTIALIGPTGVGKTTTIAKLAATFKLRQNLNVGLITLDTYRIAAVDQLRTYANIIGVPLHVVISPEELRAAIEKCRSCDAVLIDTAGRSQRDDPRLGQLKSFISAADPHEVHLVLSSTGSMSVLMDAAERFSAIRADRIIFTKLDEAVSFGVLLNVARKVNKRLSYVTTGQEVPHQIEASRPGRIAELVLGGEI